MKLKILQKLEKDLQYALNEIFTETGINISDAGKELTLSECDKGLSVRINKEKIHIEYSRKCELFRAIGIAKEHFNEENYEIAEEPTYKTLAILSDNSRNAVNNIATIKQSIRTLALMGYNMYMLYMEDVYEVPEYKYFGYMRGRFTKAEIKELDEYAMLLGIELVPAIQTLAHLNAIYKWPEFSNVRDIDDILLVGEESTYKLLDCMLKSISEMFSSRRINVGMDEAFSLGKGRYLDINGHHCKKDIMLKHLYQVMDICKRYEFQPMMWSDMFTRNGDVAIESLPADIADYMGLVHWDYVTGKTEYAVDALNMHKKLAKNVLFAGGAWKWEGYVPFMEYSYFTSRNALEATKQCGIDEVIVTAWGDGGGDASLFSVLPVYQLFAEACYADNTTDEHIAKRLLACADAVMEDFTALELPNLPAEGGIGGGYEINPNRYLIFQDILMGLYDRHVIEDDFAKYFEKLVPIYENAAKRNPKWAYIFELMLSLSKLLQYKCDMGIKLKKAYDSKDKTELKNLLDKLHILKNLCGEFHEKVRKQWLTENKAFGLDVQDIRIGGLSARIDTAIFRVNDYITGKIDKMEELEEDRLFADGRPEDSDASPNTHMWFWRDVVSAGVIER